MLKREPASIHVPGAGGARQADRARSRSGAQDPTLAAPNMEPGVLRPRAPIAHFVSAARLASINLSAPADSASRTFLYPSAARRLRS